MDLDFMGWIIAPLALCLLNERAQHVSRWLVKTAGKLSPPEQRADRTEEWLANLEAIQGNTWKLYHALGILLRFGVVGVAGNVSAFGAKVSAKIVRISLQWGAIMMAVSLTMIWTGLEMIFAWNFPTLVNAFIAGGLGVFGSVFYAFLEARRAARAARNKAKEG